MSGFNKAHIREILFRASVLLKGLDALLEISGGVALWFISPGLIIRATAYITQDKTRKIRHAAGYTSLSSEHFMALYLLTWGR